MAVAGGGDYNCLKPVSSRWCVGILWQFHGLEQAPPVDEAVLESRGTLFCSIKIESIFENDRVRWFREFPA